MLTESVILALMVVVMWYFTLRSGRRGIAFALLPLLVVPCANVIAAALAPRLDLLSDALGARHWQVLFVLGALVVTMALVGAISRNIRRKGHRDQGSPPGVSFCMRRFQPAFLLSHPGGCPPQSLGTGYFSGGYLLWRKCHSPALWGGLKGKTRSSAAP